MRGVKGRDLLGLGALVLTSCSWACSTPRQPTSQVIEAARVCAAGPTLRGIDVSIYQGVIDWPKVKTSGVTFAFIRVSDGVGGPDRNFATNWANARAAGVIRGVYQFFREDEDPVAEADLLLDMMGTLEPDDLPPVIDVETADGQSQATVVDHIGKWLDRIETATGRKAIIYAGLYSWPSLAGGSDAYVDHALWIPQYGPTCPSLPAPWTNWAFFQYSDTMSIDGIDGNVDGDYFNGDLKALQDQFMALPPPAPDAAPPPVVHPDAHVIVVSPDAAPGGNLAGEVTSGCNVGTRGASSWWPVLGLLALFEITRSRRGSSR
jgi:lysozyme